MIQISRANLHAFKTVLRKSVLMSSSKHAQCFIVFSAGPDGLRLQAQGANAALELLVPGSFPQITFCLNLIALADLDAARQDTAVELAPDGNDVAASWRHGQVPWQRRLPQCDMSKLPAFPTLPERMTEMAPAVLEALAFAAETVSDQTSRFALNLLQLKGREGQIVSTDGRQALFQSAGPWPWNEDVLVPSIAAFDLPQLQGHDAMLIGKCQDFVTLQCGPWTVHLPIQKEARYPNVQQAVPTKASSSGIHLGNKDVQFLLQTLKHLPGQQENFSPVTLDANGQVFVRAKAEADKQPTEVLLANTHTRGKAVRLALNRTYLDRALRLGFEDFSFHEPDNRLFCQRDGCQYLVQPLPSNFILPANPRAVRIVSEVSSNTPQSPSPPRRTEIMASPSINGNGKGVQHDEANGTQVNGNGVHNLIAEVESLKTLLRDGYKRACQIASGLKRHKKQAQVVQHTLVQLRQLQHVGE